MALCAVWLLRCLASALFSFRLRLSSVARLLTSPPIHNPARSYVRQFAKSLILLTLIACGAPGSEQVFTKVGQKPPQPVVVKRPAPPPAALAAKRFQGFYYRLGDTSRFTPCGDKTGLDVFGNPEARFLLRERVRWTSPWQGLRMYAQFMGYVVTDTPKVQGRGADTTARVPRTRFFLTAVESLRVREREDCGGARP